MERVSELKDLIDKRQKELEFLRGTLGIGFPIVEDKKMRRIAYLEMVIDNLKSLKTEPKLNENQQIVLDYLKYRFNHQPYMLKQSVLSSIDDLLSDCDDDDVNDAIFTFEPKDEIDVLQAFIQWAREQEEE